MSTLHIYRGVPASGKTTAAMEWIQEQEGRVRVNRDDIRFSMFGKYWGVDEQAVNVMEQAALTAAMRRGLEIVSDNTNLNAKNVRGLIALAQKWGYGVQFRDFEVSLAVAMLRDRKREKRVGDEVIQSFFDRYMRKGFPPVPAAPPKVEFPKYVPDTTKPHAILVDIDGTLAHMNGRSPYDNTRVHEDTVDEVVSSIVDWYYWETQTAVIVLSGRDSECRPQTEHWLSVNSIKHHHLFMRAAGDKRNDAVVKNELFEKHIAPYYNVRFALDDRDRVVEMWRAKGIKCLQVEPGDF